MSFRLTSAEVIDQQLFGLTPLWEENQESLDLSFRIAKLWEERLVMRPTSEILEGTYFYYHHANRLLGGADPAITEKLADLDLMRLDLRIREIEDWLIVVSGSHPEADAYRAEVNRLKRQKADALVAKAVRTKKSDNGRN